MFSNFFQRRKILKSTNTLDLVPVKLVNHEFTDNGKIKLIVPRFKNELLSNIFTGRHKGKHFKISLDETGSKTWLSIDNEKNIGEIAKELQNDRTGNKPFEESLASFFVKLYNEGFITFRQLLISKG